MPDSTMRRVFGGGVGDVEMNRVGRPAAPGDALPPATYNAQAQYTKQYAIDVGFQSVGNVPAGATVDIPVRTVTPFEPYRMTVGSDIAFDFDLVQMTLQDRLFVDGAPVQCSKYSEVAVEKIELEIGTINTTDTLILRVTNTSAVPLPFKGSFRGHKLSR